MNVLKNIIIFFLICVIHQTSFARETGCKSAIENKLSVLAKLIEGEKPKEYGVYLCKKIELSYYDHKQFFQTAIIYSSDGIYWSEHLVVFYDMEKLDEAGLVGYIRIGGKAENMNDSNIESNGNEIIIHANRGPNIDGPGMWLVKKYYSIKDHALIKVREENE